MSIIIHPVTSHGQYSKFVINNIRIPYPVTVNRYLIRTKNGRYIKSEKYRKYIKDFNYFLINQGMTVDEEWMSFSENVLSYEVRIRIFYRDKKKRDIDNILKPILDSFCSYGLIKDDSLIRSIFISKGYFPYGSTNYPIDGGIPVTESMFLNEMCDNRENNYVIHKESPKKVNGSGERVGEILVDVILSCR